MTKDELCTKTFGVVSLGCDKNRVDCEKMVYLLKNYGLQYVEDLTKANIIIVNTCAFIQSAKKESVDSICEVMSYKADYVCEKLIVTGCLSQRYYSQVKDGFPEVDAVVRLKNNSQILNIVKGLYGLDITQNDCAKATALARVVSTPSYFAYLKIADGCNNCCAYCTIPQIRGRYVSVPPKVLVKEAKELAKNGVRELILVAQDVTNYGSDLFGKPMLVELLKELSKIKKIKWIRLHYCYPNLISDELLQEVSSNPKICKYLDIPMQHANDEILKAMNRRDTKESYEELLQKIRKLPNFVAIRSTFIVGFPGETNKNFAELVDFLKKQKMQYVGFFKYSREEYTAAYGLPHQVTEKVKESRLREAEMVQEQIMLESQRKFVGKTMLCVLEKISDDGTCELRNQYNSPSIDTIVYADANNKKLKVGEFYQVNIISIDGIDLKGEIL